MKTQHSAFYETAIQLSLREVLSLLMGGTVKGHGYVLATYHMPDNGCPCKYCKQAYGR